MPIAESIGTALGEAIGYCKKTVSEMSVKDMLNELTSDKSTSRQKKISYADSVNDGKAGVHESGLRRAALPVNDSCLKARKLSVDFDAVAAAETFHTKRQANETKGVGATDYVHSLLKSVSKSVFNSQAASEGKTGFLASSKPISSDEEFELAQLELAALIADVDKMNDCLSLSMDKSADGVCSFSYDLSDGYGVALTQGRTLTNQARVNLSRSIFSMDLADRHKAGGEKSRIELIEEQVLSSQEGGPLSNELNLNAAHEVPVLKEVIMNQMLTNQLLVELIFEEEKRIALLASNVLTVEEGKR
tara:strand:- start:993 stop:1904 length:912 start_codon:yes stop_codon:yes gene_type:complete